MKVVEVPAQILLFPVIETAGVTEELTVIVIALEVSGLFVTPARLDVIIQVTIWPLVNPVVV